jgi:hypothetical protein
VFVGSVTVCFTYDPDLVTIPEHKLRIFHMEGDPLEWKDITVQPVDTLNNVICGRATSLSPFVMAAPCCGFYTGPAGYTGNANCSDDGKLTLSDISKLIDRVYISKAPLCCEATGNTNASVDCKITLSDITVVIDAVYISKTPPAACMPECE